MPEPGLRPSTGITRLRRYHGPLRLPQGPRLTISDHPGWWPRPTTSCGSRTLPRRPCLRMLTPLPRLERTGSSVGCSPAPRRPSPYGRRVGSSEKLSRPAQGSNAFGLRLCTLVAQGLPRRLQPDDYSRSTAPVATGRTDNSPGGTCTRWPSRPRRSLRKSKTQLTSDLLSCRTATLLSGPRKVPPSLRGFRRESVREVASVFRLLIGCGEIHSLHTRWRRRGGGLDQDLPRPPLAHSEP